MRITRRTFLATSAAGAASLALPLPTLASSRRLRSANEEIRIAVVGVRGRGRDHITAFSKMPNVRIVALCDVDQQILERELKALRDRKIEAEGVADIRTLLDRKDIDAVSVATPNHWHALMGVWACQAGKDVFLEKPVSHNVWEGRQIVRAARAHNRIVQTGTQSRSSTAIPEAIAWVRVGHLGDIKLARGLCYKPRRSIGKVSGPQEIPSFINHDLWTGPAPLKPLGRKNLHYDWHWDFDTGNADLGNQGIHQMDVCRWFLGEKFPTAVGSFGGRFAYQDDGNTPNTQIIWFDYPTAPLIFEVRGLPRDQAAQADKWEEKMDRNRGLAIGSVIECAGGYVAISEGAEVIAYDDAGKEVKRWKSGNDHYQNFIAAMRSRKVSDLAADIEEGHVSSALCHLGNISYLLGASMNRDAAASIAAANGGPWLAESLARFQKHLDANGIDLDKTPGRLGPWLSFNPATERFTDHEQANTMLRREYRTPFVVPEIA